MFLALGDWGDSFYWDPDSPQLQVAAAMNDWASVNQARFILTTGDNFYPDGVRVRMYLCMKKVNVKLQKGPDTEKFPKMKTFFV